MHIEIRELPSGFWSVWADNDWLTASAANEDSAKEFVKEVFGEEALKDVKIKRK